MLTAAVSAKGSAARLLEAAEAGRTAAVQAMLTGRAGTASTFLSWHIDYSRHKWDDLSCFRDKQLSSK